MSTAEENPKKRARAGGPKSKGGCITCKQRRVKCDEAKPGCLRCKKYGRDCDGYATAVPTRPARDTRLRPSNPAIAPKIVLTPSPSSQSPQMSGVGTSSGRHSQSPGLVSPDIAGCFEQNFWNNAVLQLSNTKAAVKHALIALRALHEATRNTGYAKPLEYTVPLRCYSKALREVREIVTTGENCSKDVVLTCFLLFISFECLRGNYGGAVVHLDNGLSFIENRNQRFEDDKQKSRSYFRCANKVDERLLFLTRLDLSAMAAFMPPTSQPFPETMSYHNDLSPNSVPLREAQRQLEELQRRALFFLTQTFQPRHSGSAGKVDVELNEVMSGFSNWSTRLSQILSQSLHNGLQVDELQSGLMLLMQHRAATVPLQVLTDPGCPKSRSEETDACELLTLTSSMLKQQIYSTGQKIGNRDAYGRPCASTSRRRVALGVDITAPLFLIAMSPFHLALRLRALDALRTTHLTPALTDPDSLSELVSESEMQILKDLSGTEYAFRSIAELTIIFGIDAVDTDTETASTDDDDYVAPIPIPTATTTAASTAGFGYTSLDMNMATDDMAWPMANVAFGVTPVGMGYATSYHGSPTPGELSDYIENDQMDVMPLVGDVSRVMDPRGMNGAAYEGMW